MIFEDGVEGDTGSVIIKSDDDQIKDLILYYLEDPLQQHSVHLASRRRSLAAYLELTPFLIGEVEDSGLLHALLSIETMEELHGHPAYGASWEGFALENVLAGIRPGIKASFYRDSNGSEIDLILEKGKNGWRLNSRPEPPRR